MITLDLDTGRNNGKIVSGDFAELREHFSVKNEAANFARRRGFFVKDRNYLITPTGKFELHFVDEIIKWCRENDIQVEITDRLKKATVPILKFNFQDPKLNLQLRDYQEEVVKTCLQFHHGIIELATSGGKTLIISSLLENLYRENPDFKCLIIVPDLGLVKQTKGDFNDYGVNFTYSIWTGKDELDFSTNVIIANTGILLSEKSNTEWTESIDVLIVDEVHKVRKGNKINKLIKRILTFHKFGFTGTLPEEPMDQWNIFSKFGSVKYSKKAHELKLESYVTPAKVAGLRLNYLNPPIFRSADIDNPTELFTQEQKYIISSDYRNNFISNLCDRVDNNCLILVDLIDHGLELEKKLTENKINKEIYFIRGEVDVEERRRVQKLMEEQNNICVIAISKIFSTGINIKNLHYLIFSAGGKAKVKIIQSIGRGLRLHSDKKQFLIFDIIDNLRYGLQHFEKRKQLYKQEQIPYGVKDFYEK